MVKQTEHNRSAIVIGSGFAGLSAAICLAAEGFRVTILEKNAQPGGRARMFEEAGFRFDMGPSWYWMPEVIAGFFNRFHRSVDDYYNLVRLDPSYQVYFGGDELVKVPADYAALRQLFGSMEKGSDRKLDAFLEEAAGKYAAGMGSFAHKPGQSINEFMELDVLRAMWKMDMLKPFSVHVRKYFKDPRILRILEFPVLFLGAVAEKIPALYSMMNYADIRLGTWYPMGGMHQLVTAMVALAMEMDVNILLNTEVLRLDIHDRTVSGVETAKGRFEADIVVAGADYRHVDQELLPPGYAGYSPRYWETRKMAPSCLLYYVGVNRELPRLLHHNLFFEHDLAGHARAIYDQPSWPEHPLYYACCPSKTDASVAPEGMENLFFLIPTAPGLEDTPAVREHYFHQLIERTGRFCGTDFRKDIVFQKSYAASDFITDYHAFKGNAYGLANTLRQTALLKPSITSRKISNLFFTGQLTVPGPGVPPAIISGQVVADYIIKHHNPVYESAV